MNIPDEELKKKLTPEQYKIVREKGTEQPGTGEYLHNKETGMYACIVCGTPLFSSDTKYDSGTGWPSFYAPVGENNVGVHKDDSHGMVRDEVICRKCGAHLGHVFDDGPTLLEQVPASKGEGPKPTGKRFCINSKSLNFKKQG